MRKPVKNKGETEQVSLSASAKELIELDVLYKETYKTTDSIVRDFYRKHSKLPFESWKEQYKSFADFKKACLPEEKVEEKVTRESLSIVKDGLKGANKKRYVITAAIEGDTLCRPFYKALQSYITRNNAELVILPMRGVLSHHKGYDPEIMEFQHYFATEYRFNNNIKCLDLKIHPRQFLPLSQINRLGHDMSFIVAHSKVQFETSPVLLGKLPHIIHSTGAITNGETYGEIRSGKISELDHTIGAVILEVEDAERYYIRHIEFDTETNSFYDLDKQYFASGQVKQAKAEAMYLGDYHSGYTDEDALNATYEMIDLLQPKYTFVGDVFDGTSISHHSINNIKAQIQRPDHLSTLEKELNHMAMNLRSFVQRCPKTKLMLVEGNHENHLEFYLRECRYKDDRWNHLLALKLAIHMIEGRNPIQEYVFGMFPELKKNIKFLSRKDSFKVKGIELAQHGDQTANGLKGGISAIERTFTNGVIGHGHSPKIYRKLYMAGTLSRFDLPYVSSPASAWLNSNVSIYPNGQRQLLHSVYGNWKMD